MNITHTDWQTRVRAKHPKAQFYSARQLGYAPRGSGNGTIYAVEAGKLQVLGYSSVYGDRMILEVAVHHTMVK